MLNLKSSERAGERMRASAALGHKDDGTSPLVVLVMSAAKVTLYLLGGLVVIVMGVFLWQQHKTGQPMANGDWGMVGVLLVLALLCFFMAHKIATLLQPRS